MRLETAWRSEDDGRFPLTVWQAGPGVRMISSAVLGGGLGRASWVLNAQVADHYARKDPDVHLTELAGAHGLSGPGVGMLTAAPVDRAVIRSDGGVTAAATVGLKVPTWAAAPPDSVAPTGPGTINIIVSVPVALSDAAMVNAVVTATEAKTQALLEAGYPCTGTASDAICIAAPNDGTPQPFAGPRSTWGAPLARAVHAAVLAGARAYTP